MIMDWALLVISTVAAVEILVRVPLVETLSTLSVAAVRARDVSLSARISHHWKARILPLLVLETVTAAFEFCVWTLLALAPVGLAVLASELLGGDLQGLLLRWNGLLVAIGLGIAAAFALRVLRHV